MKNIKLIYVAISFFTIFSCGQKIHLNTHTKIGTEQAKLVFANYLYGDTNLGISMDFTNKKNSKIVFVNGEGHIQYYEECDQLGRPINGGSRMFFEKNRLQQLAFLDSNGNLEGPVFIYKKNGKLKHVFIYKGGKYLSTYFSARPNSINNDTMCLK